MRKSTDPRIVIALGGNALGNNLPEQMLAVKKTAKAIADRAKSMNPDDSDVNYVLENINYALDTYFNK